MDDFLKKLKKLTETSEKTNIFNNKNVNTLNYNVQNNQINESIYGNEKSHSVYESDSDFLNQTSLNLKKDKIDTSRIKNKVNNKITNDDQNIIKKKEEEFNKIIEELENTYLVLKYLNDVKSKGNEKYNEYTKKYINAYDINKFMRNKEKEIQLIQEKKKNQIDNIINNGLPDKNIESLNKLLDKKHQNQVKKNKQKFEKNIETLQKNIDKQKTKFKFLKEKDNLIATMIDDLLKVVEEQQINLPKIQEAQINLNQMEKKRKKNINILEKEISKINNDVDMQSSALRDTYIYDENLKKIKNRLLNNNLQSNFNNKIDEKINIYKNELDEIKIIINILYKEIEKYYVKNENIMKIKNNDYNSMFSKNKKILINFEKDIHNDHYFNSQISKINENREILKHNIEYLKENNSYINKKKNIIFIFGCLLFIVGIAVIISFFINIYLMFK